MSKKHGNQILQTCRCFSQIHVEKKIRLKCGTREVARKSTQRREFTMLTGSWVLLLLNPYNLLWSFHLPSTGSFLLFCYFPQYNVAQSPNILLIKGKGTNRVICRFIICYDPPTKQTNPLLVVSWMTTCRVVHGWVNRTVRHKSEPNRTKPIGLGKTWTGPELIKPIKLIFQYD